jgi:hypothetical protein
MLQWKANGDKCFSLRLTQHEVLFLRVDFTLNNPVSVFLAVNIRSVLKLLRENEVGIRSNKVQ